MTFQEKFEIGGYEYGIEKKEVGYQVWRNGCALSTPHQTIAQARQYILGHAEGSLKSSIRNTQANLAFLEGELAKLGTGGDIFYLAKFLVE